MQWVNPINYKLFLKASKLTTDAFREPQDVKSYVIKRGAAAHSLWVLQSMQHPLGAVSTHTVLLSVSAVTTSLYFPSRFGVLQAHPNFNSVANLIRTPRKNCKLKMLMLSSRQATRIVVFLLLHIALHLQNEQDPKTFVYNKNIEESSKAVSVCPMQRWPLFRWST